MSARRIVVVGSGMAATRLVEELVARDTGDQITVLGDERHAPYNRILLSAVLEGTHPVDALTLRSLEWYADHGVDLRVGTRVLGVDREHRDVMLVDGTCIPYDRLVLATGSIPSLPPIRGLVQLDGRLHERVHAFRSLDDCQRLMRAVPDRAPGRGRRRRPARAPGGPGAQRARPRHRDRRGRRARAPQPGRRAGRVGARSATSPGSAPPSTPAPAPSGSADGTAGSSACGWTTASSSTPTWSCSPPAAAPPRRWLAGPG